MIITLNADFSANNIGKIEVPVEPTARQKAIMAKYSRALTGAQQSAFVIFMNTLENNNILSKMNAFYLPIMAGAVSEAFVNVVDENLDADFEPDAKWLLDTDGGIYLNSDYPSSDNVFTLTTSKQLSGLTFGDWHILWSTNLRSKEIITQDGEYTKQYFPILANNDLKTWYKIGVGTERGSWCATYQRLMNNNVQYEMPDLFDIDSVWNTYIEIDKTKDDLFGYSVKSNNYYVLSQSLKKTYPKKSGANLSLSLSDFNVCGVPESISPYIGGGMKAPCRILSVGKGLTEAEYNIYVNAMQVFLSEF